ncbi:MAG: RnfABCDGE type electron transport complex subunit D [Thiotrichales bacterium]
MTVPVAHSPHAHAATSLGGVMGTVMLALTPATLFGFWMFGWPALNLWLITIASAVLAEAWMLWMLGRAVRTTLLDGSAVLTGWLLALTLPPWAPWWIGVLGAAFAIVVVKQVFGGLGQNVFNPAMAARVMLLISFPLEMTTWALPASVVSADAPSFWHGLEITFLSPPLDGMTGATTLGQVKTALGQGMTLDQALTADYSLIGALLGERGGSPGETAALLLLAGGLLLIARRVITWHAPIAMIVGVALPALVFHLIDPNRYADPLFHLLSGALMLAAFFIITDPVGSPNTGAGQLLFGLGCGLLTWIIRTWGGYPEGVAFAVMLMNAATPIIDRHVRPRVYGRTRRGDVLDPPKDLP